MNNNASTNRCALLCLWCIGHNITLPRLFVLQFPVANYCYMIRQMRRLVHLCTQWSISETVKKCRIPKKRTLLVQSTTTDSLIVPNLQ